MESFLFALGAAALFGAGLVVTQFGLAHLAAAAGAAISIPCAATLFWLAAPIYADFHGWHAKAAAMFALVGVFFPAIVALLTFRPTGEWDRRLPAQLEAPLPCSLWQQPFCSWEKR